MELQTHTELFIRKGIIDRLPNNQVNGTILTENLKIELSLNNSVLPGEVIHIGDEVFFFLVPTKYLTTNYAHLEPFTAVNVSRYRRRIYPNGLTYSRPCSFGTTIPSTQDPNSSIYYNFSLSEYCEIAITTANFEIIPFQLFEDDRDIPPIPCPYNPAIIMSCTNFIEPLASSWE